MLYVARIDVPSRKVWGGVFQTELVIPSKVNKIRSICAVAIPQATYLSRSEDTDRSDVADSAQVGCVSVSIGNTNVIIDSLPIYVNAELENNSYNSLKMELSEPAKLDDGALLRTIVEESRISPFSIIEGGSFPPYAVKIFLEYDK